jgi:hypothetical protein
MTDLRAPKAGMTKRSRIVFSSPNQTYLELSIFIIDKLSILVNNHPDMKHKVLSFDPARCMILNNRVLHIILHVRSRVFSNLDTIRIVQLMMKLSKENVNVSLLESREKFMNADD